jgi:phage terminase large subunit
MDSVIVGRSRDGKVISKFKTAGGSTVRVLDRNVYRKASAAASRKLREILDRDKAK